MTPKDILTNPYFCPMPWTGMMYNFDGSVKNCIRSNDAMPIGNLQNNNIQEILGGVENRNRQIAIQQRQPVKSCTGCYDLEKDQRGFDGISDRVFYIRELKENDPSIYSSVGRPGLQAIDIRWTNLCNFACVYCGPDFSSRWADELQMHLATPTKEQIDSLKWYITSQANTLKHVYLAGGEPLLMKENLELLDILKTVNPNVNLRINTNLSKVDTRVFDKICEFKNVHWTISAETTGDEFEYIRYGGKWTDFLDNLNTIRKLNHKISFNMLWFILNFNSIFDCVDYLTGIGFHNNSFIIGALAMPDYLNIRHLPESVLYSLEEKLNNRIAKKPGFLLEESYKNMLNYIKQPIEKNFLRSMTQLNELDQRRNLDSSKIFKELYNIKENYHGK